MPNTIGFSLYDENGKVIRKFQEDEYYYSEPDHPLIISETFNNLDFANHRYTIVPTTRPMDKDFFQVDMPDGLCTTVLCPDSRHPHLIDLGLPSGTKWLCRNLHADNPKDAGGYYQWGKPAMVHNYNNITYYTPNISTSNYQGAEYDAATVNLGLPYVTPTLSQFDELFDNCGYDLNYSTWGNSAKGVYLKGRNGSNLYLPFSGFKLGSTVNSDSNETGYFLTSDVFSGDDNKYGKVTLVNKDGRGSTDIQGYGYSVRPVSAESTGLIFEPQEIDFEEVLIASQNLSKVSKSVRATNTGTAPITVTVSPTIVPYSVSPETVGTFILQPKESRDIYVTFEPTDIAEYKSELTIQYETGNSTTVCKVPLWGKGINEAPVEAIDLGLPSGTKWASCNVGATKPEEYGGYYAWGETEEKDYYYWDNYMCEDDECGTTKDPIYTWNGKKLYADIAGSKFDVATSKWGPSWQMPSSAQMDELLNECIWTWCDGDMTKYNGTSVKGYIISSKVNNNKIFLPAAGNYYKDELIYGDEYCLYWSSSQFEGTAFEGEAYYTNANSAIGMGYNYKQTYVDLRYYGQTVRPVATSNSAHAQQLILEGMKYRKRK